MINTPIVMPVESASRRYPEGLSAIKLRIYSHMSIIAYARATVTDSVSCSEIAYVR
jgi:hypothetical protein